MEELTAGVLVDVQVVAHNNLSVITLLNFLQQLLLWCGGVIQDENSRLRAICNFSQLSSTFGPTAEMIPDASNPNLAGSWVGST